MSRVEDFHKKRTMFYVWNGIVYVAPKNDPRGHKEFINNFNIFNNCIRGYYMDKKLVVYTDGNLFNSIELSVLTALISTIINALNVPIGASVYNGIKKGKIGAIWEPKHCFDIT